MSTRILVTGATGMAGRFIVPALRRLGFEVRAQYRKWPGQTQGVEWRQMDFLESWDFNSLVAGCDAVIHLAAELADVSRMNRVNVEATHALLAAAQSCGVRYFGHASSIVVYGSPRRRPVDEATPLLNPHASIARQYNAEPYMLEYARTKTLGEAAIRAFQPSCNVDFYRPTVVADLDRLLEAGRWTHLRKLGAAYRRTQYIYAPDAAAAVTHLLTRGLAAGRPHQQVEAFNICDQECGTYHDLLATAYKTTGDPRFRVRASIPVVLDLANAAVKYRSLTLRYPLGMLMFSNAKLRATGFTFPSGVKSALRQALSRNAPPATAASSIPPPTLTSP
jgi:nucleoside-diphosphate-sugar epimerase